MTKLILRTAAVFFILVAFGFLTLRAQNAQPSPSPTPDPSSCSMC